MHSWVANPVEETTSNGITLIQHGSLAKSITSSDRQDLMITSMNKPPAVCATVFTVSIT